MADAGTTSAVEPRIAVRYRTTLGDQLHVAMVAARRSIWFTVLGSLLLVAGFGNAWLSGDPTSILLGLLGLAAVTGLFSIPFAWFAVRRAPELLYQDWESIATPDRLIERSSTITMDARWSLFREVQETGRVFVLYGPSGAIFLPKRAFGEADLAAFRALLAAVRLRPVAGNAARRVVVATAVIALIVFAAAALAVGVAFVH